MGVSTTASARTASSIHEPSVTVVTRVRRRVRALLAAWELGRDRIDDAVLVIEELVANVVDHARTQFRLFIELTDGQLYLAVSDDSDRIPEPRPHDVTAARGRGLQLVGTLAGQWGCDQHKPGKTVWAILAV